MIIDGFQKITLLDYPSKVACIIFTRGCNLKCPFCQNSSLINCSKNCGNINEDEIFEYLDKRKNILDGVVISGGEPLVQKDIKKFIKKIKEYGLSIKLDTNGTNPKLLEELIDEHLIDYVAMDIKNIFSKYSLTAGNEAFEKNIEKSIELLKQNKVEYEFRTTIVKEYHKLCDLENICKLVGCESRYYLQNFEDSEEVINHNLHGFSHDELLFINDKLKKSFPNMVIRSLA